MVSAGGGLDSRKSAHHIIDPSDRDSSQSEQDRGLRYSSISNQFDLQEHVSRPTKRQVELVGNKDSFLKPALGDSRVSSSGSTPSERAAVLTPNEQRGHKRQNGQSNIDYKNLSQQPSRSSHTSSNSINNVGLHRAMAGIALDGGLGSSRSSRAGSLSRPGSGLSSASSTERLGVIDTPENYFQSPFAKKEAPVRKSRQSSGKQLHSDDARNPGPPAPQYANPIEQKKTPGFMGSTIWGLGDPREDTKFIVELPQREGKEKKGHQGEGELNRLQKISQGLKARVSESKQFLDRHLRPT